MLFDNKNRSSSAVFVYLNFTYYIFISKFGVCAVAHVFLVADVRADIEHTFAALKHKRDNAIRNYRGEHGKRAVCGQEYRAAREPGSRHIYRFAEIKVENEIHIYNAERI